MSPEHLFTNCIIDIRTIKRKIRRINNQAEEKNPDLVPCGFAYFPQLIKRTVTESEVQ